MYDLLLDTGKFYIQAFDELNHNNGTLTTLFRWQSHEFRIYSKKCVDPVKALNCSLEGKEIHALLGIVLEASYTISDYGLQ